MGLGEDFLSSVDACVRGLLRNPETYPVVFESYRHALVRRFPYAVFYEFDGETVTIYCVFHAARDPESWRRRLP